MQSPRSPFNEVLTHRFTQVLYQCLETVGSTKGALYLSLKGEEGFRLVSHYGFPRLVPPPERMGLEEPLVKWVQRERRTFAVNNASQFHELASLIQGAEAPRLLFTPIYDKGQWIGFLVQRDRVRGEAYEVSRDEAPTLTICQEIVLAVHEFRLVFTSSAGESPEPEHGVPLAHVIPPPTLEEAPTLPVVVPPSESMFAPPAPKEFTPGLVLEGFVSGAEGEEAFAHLTKTGAYVSRNLDEPTVVVPPPQPGASGQPGSGQPALRPGMFLPEQRTFFWEAASLLASIVPLAAIALWMDEPQELRPILTYSRLPLSAELKQQILAHATYHIDRVEEKDLRILTKSEWMEENPLRGIFQTYLPVVLMEEGGGQDLLLLFRQEERPFSEEEQLHIQQVARMLGFHLQEGRLHEQYHRAFLSVAHRILSTVEGGAPSLRSHSLNTAKLARNFAVRLELPSHEVEAVSISAILHDVGTLLLDPKILAKPKLTPEDLARVRTHPVLASAFLKDFRFPFDVLRVIRHHHERWDGKGYPDGLKGEEIPIGSRIISIIEAFEVMSSGNGYKSPKSSREILEELRREASAQFDPALVSDFIDYLASKARRAEQP
jgi:HD-GYP domain-containing protein (c-di-GMP phosphodiesterase class II)